MKTLSFLTLVSLSLTLSSRAQPSAPASQTVPPVSDTAFSPASRDFHTTLWQKIEYEEAPTGEWRSHVHRYIETATGLNFFDSTTGTWQPSVENIEPSPGGAVAARGQHKVTFAADLATTGAIKLQMPDGQQLQTELLGLAYSDQASGKTIFFAVVTNSIGAIIG
jgi:hypothetical protein